MCVFKNHAFIYFLRPPSWSGTLIFTLPLNKQSPTLPHTYPLFRCSTHILHVSTHIIPVSTDILHVSTHILPVSALFNALMYMFPIMLTGPIIKTLLCFFNLQGRKIYTVLTQFVQYKISMKGSFDVKVITWDSGLWCMSANPCLFWSHAVSQLPHLAHMASCLSRHTP